MLQPARVQATVVGITLLIGAAGSAHSQICTPGTNAAIAFNLSGVVTVAQPNALDGWNDFTIECWIWS